MIQAHPLHRDFPGIRTTEQTIGHTPLVRLAKMFPDPMFVVLAKLEFMNPSGSIKDRVARHIINDAEASGLIQPGRSILVEASSGNTGAAIAMIAAMRGYSAIITMPAKASIEKQMAPRLYGAEVIVCPSSAKPEDPDHYMQRARTIAESTPGAFFINQYDNPKNADAHDATGREIWEQTSGNIDYFVSGGSTGGTVSGVGRHLKKRKPGVRVVMPDPVGSAIYSLFYTGQVDRSSVFAYGVEGIGKERATACMDLSVVDEVMQVTDKDAFEAAKKLAKTEGLLVGGSSGANLWACMELTQKLSAPATIVTTLPDSGLKYLSSFYAGG
jgi:cystathionine beta-synthase